MILKKVRWNSTLGRAFSVSHGRTLTWLTECGRTITGGAGGDKFWALTLEHHSMFWICLSDGGCRPLDAGFVELVLFFTHRFTHHLVVVL